MGKNRRNLRVTARLPAGVEGPRGPVKGTCRSLSPGGMFFVGGPLTVGQTLEFWIELPKGKVTAMGELRYAHEYPDGVGVGVRFTRFTQDGIAMLNDYLASSPEAR